MVAVVKFTVADGVPMVGTDAGITEADGEEAALAPTAFTAVTSKA
jgi:hypothetical protein